jgi:hypothetical protein
MPGHAGDIGMDVQRPEASAEGELLLWRQVLITEEDHLVLDEGRADLRDHRVRQLGREVDAGNLGAQGAGRLADLQSRHRSSPLAGANETSH